MLSIFLKYSTKAQTQILSVNQRNFSTPLSGLTNILLSHLNLDQSAAMAEDSLLEILAPELQLQILFKADTPKDLHALIHTSPRLYQVYIHNKDTILSTVARRQFHPAVIHDALFFAKISQLEQPLSRDTVLELCKTYSAEVCEGKNLPVSMSVALCELASNVKFFIEDYARNTLPILEGLGRSLDLEVLPEYLPENLISHSRISDSEIGRLQRAFCRFEIYRYLFARCSSTIDHELRRCAHEPSLDPADQAELFLERFPDFQVTEINCIRDYLYRRLRGVFSRVEDMAADTLPADTFIWGPGVDWEGDSWASGVWLFTNSGKHYQDQHIEHLMSLGLSYIRRIFSSTGEEQKTLFMRHNRANVLNHAESDFITTALGCLGPNPARGDTPLLAKTDPPFKYERNSDVELDIPDAWQWAHPRAPPLMLSDFCEKGLRDWGYVFWDFDRLQESGILQRR